MAGLDPAIFATAPATNPMMMTHNQCVVAP
jgi:hypothetical protein